MVNIVHTVDKLEIRHFDLSFAIFGIQIIGINLYCFANTHRNDLKIILRILKRVTQILGHFGSQGTCFVNLVTNLFKSV